MRRALAAAVFGLVGGLAAGSFGRVAAAQTVNVRTVNELFSAVEGATPGTIISVAPGSYEMRDRFTTRMGGLADRRIVVRSATRHAAILRTNGAEEAFQIRHPHWTIEGFHIRVVGGSPLGIKLDTNGHHTRIAGNRIELDSPGEIGIKGSGGANAPRPDDALIEDNVIWMNSPARAQNAVGIDAVAIARWVIRRNIVHHIQKSSDPGFDGIGYGIFTKGNSQDNVIEGNLVYNCFIGLSFGGGGTGASFFRDGDRTYEDRNGIMRNNMILDSTDVAIYLNKANNARIYNNSTFNSFTSCGPDCSSIDVRFAGAVADIRNNILDKQVLPRDGGRFTEGSNLYLSTPSDDAWFVRAVDGDLRLRAGTPPIDAGETLALVTDDADGAPRPFGAGYDIGAHEFGSTPPPPPDAGVEEPDAGFAEDAVVAFPDAAIDEDAVGGEPDAPADSGPAPGADADIAADAAPRADSERRGTTTPARRSSGSCSCTAAGRVSGVNTWPALLLLGWLARRGTRAIGRVKLAV